MDTGMIGWSYVIAHQNGAISEPEVVENRKHKSCSMMQQHTRTNAALQSDAI